MEKTNETVLVMVSTYNGETYLREQLDSILNQDVAQKGIDLKIMVRDDGSTDGTIDILKEYNQEYGDIFSYYSGKNIGVTNSFFNLMMHAPEVEYYAFSDQDDIWLEGKLSKAISIIKKESIVESYDKRRAEIPFMYACALTLVDDDLNVIESKIDRKGQVPSFENALIENICAGCVEVFNKKLFNIVAYEFPEKAIMHDWWIYLVANCFGKVYFDEESYIYYRQHEINVVGMKSDRLNELTMRIKTQKEKKGRLSRQVTELVRIYQPLLDYDLYSGDELEAFKKRNEKFLNTVIRSRHSIRKLNIAKMFIEVKESYAKRLTFFNKVNIRRQRKEDDRVFQVMLRLGIY